MEKKPVDMKVSAKQAYGLASPVDTASKGRKMYPWGLEIRLDSVALDKLGIKDLPDSGTEVTLTGVGKVTEVRTSATEERKSRHITIQITKLAVTHDGGDAEKAFQRGFKRGPKKG